MPVLVFVFGRLFSGEHRRVIVAARFKRFNNQSFALFASFFPERPLTRSGQLNIIYLLFNVPVFISVEESSPLSSVNSELHSDSSK